MKANAKKKKTKLQKILKIKYLDSNMKFYDNDKHFTVKLKKYST